MSTMILIGSSAIKFHFPDFNRNPKDVDYIGIGKSDFLKGVEYLENPCFVNYPHSIIQPNDLYTLKASHLFWDINWEKHIYDVQFLKQKGCVLNKPLFYKLYDFWNTYHTTNKRSNLKMSSEDFFDNAVSCPYNHDYLHTLINPTPVYTKILVGEVEVGEELFEKLSFEEKLNLVREEVYVMAYERLHGRHYKHAYGWMLKKFIMSHAPIWEAIFIIDNYSLLSLPKINYVKLIESKLN